MTFRATTWGWKGTAARLLLVPVLAGTAAHARGQLPAPSYSSGGPGGSVGASVSNLEQARALVAKAKQALDTGDLTAAEKYAKQAQDLRATFTYSETRPDAILVEVAKKKKGGTGPSATMTAGKSADPKELLRAAKEALAGGRLDQAQDLAAQANAAANARGYKWGFFEDTPTGVMKDVQEARAKADKGQAADLMKRAKALASQPAADPAAKAANLDQALNMAYQAKNLSGPGSMWDFGERPEKLIAAIESAKSQVRKAMPSDAATAARTPTGKGVQQAGGPAPANDPGPQFAGGMLPPPSIGTPAVAPAGGAANPGKAAAAALVAEGRALLAQDKVVEARAKVNAAREAMAANGLTAAAFGATEDTPDQLYQAAQAKGNQMVQALVKSADEQVAAKQFPNAMAALDEAEKLSGGLGLYAKSIADRKARLAGVAPAAPQVAQVPGVPAMPAGEMLVPADAVKMPAAPLLAQAEGELRRGELESAKTIAVKAFNSDPAAKQDAQALIRTIDAEQTALKQKEAAQAVQNGMVAFAGKNYDQALAVFKLIDPRFLTETQKATVTKAMSECLEKTDAGPAVMLATSTDEPGTAKIGGTPKPTVADEQKAMQEVAFQKLRQDGIDALNGAKAAWERGETDASLRILDEYAAKVKGSGQSAARQANLTAMVTARQDMYRMFKHNTDVLVKEQKDKEYVRKEIVGARVAEAQLQDEIKAKVAEVNRLNKASKHKEAEGLALQVKQLDPDNPTLTALYETTKMIRRKAEFAQIRDDQEAMVRIGLNEGEKQGPVLTADEPLKINPERARIARQRGEELYGRARSPEEMRIEQSLSNTVSLSFTNRSLRDVIGDIRTKQRLNITTDDAWISQAKVDLDAVMVTEQLDNLSLRDALKILLEKARLSYIVENNVIKVTTDQRAAGRMTTKVFHVMELVTPIPEFGLSPHHTLAGAMQASKQLPGGLPNAGAGPTPVVPQNGMTTGTMVSNGMGAPGTTGAAAAPGVAGGQLQSAVSGSHAAMSPQRGAYSEQLKKLVTGMVRPYSWAAMGGNGSIEYYDIGGALVVNQTADVIREVQELLDSLRRLQDLSVAVEIRVVSLSEAFFERVGVDFQMNVKTNSSEFGRQAATSEFRPEPFINAIGNTGSTVGWSPATSFTSDLNFPIRSSSYGLSLPPFGGYQGALGPGTNGGLSLGLAFLNDIQVYMFLEAAQGNRRVNVMQAPKITLFNGQTSTVFVGDLAYFATGVTAYNVGGQFVYLPTNTAFPIGNGFDPNGQGRTGGVSVTVQAVISSDRRFVRLNLSPTLTALASANVPLFPVTTFVTPVFEGGSQGQPIPFTQFFQQPSFTEISAQTTVAVPDGGTVLLGGLKTMSQGRNEFGPPVLSHVPYLNRLFKNVGIGQEIRHVMLMVTPRIIINSEEEARQTGEAGGLGGPQN